MSALLKSWPLELTLLYEPRRVQLYPRYRHSDYDGVRIGRTQELIPSRWRLELYNIYHFIVKRHLF